MEPEERNLWPPCAHCHPPKHTHLHTGRDACLAGGGFQLSSQGRAKESAILQDTPHSVVPCRGLLPAAICLCLTETEKGRSAPHPVLCLGFLVYNWKGSDQALAGLWELIRWETSGLTNYFLIVCGSNIKANDRLGGPVTSTVLTFRLSRGSFATC